MSDIQELQLQIDEEKKREENLKNELERLQREYDQIKNQNKEYIENLEFLKRDNTLNYSFVTKENIPIPDDVIERCKLFNEINQNIDDFKKKKSYLCKKIRGDENDDDLLRKYFQKTGSYYL